MNPAENALSEARRHLSLGQHARACATLNQCGEALESLQHWNEALSVFRRSLEIMPDQSTVLIRIGHIYEINRNLQASFDCYRQAAAVNPEDSEAHTKMGFVLSASGNNEAAIAAFKDALRLQPDKPDAELGLCSACVDMERLEEAAHHSGRAFNRQPESALANYNHGRVLQHTNRLHEAIARYRKAIELDSGFPRPHYYLGTLYQETGEYALALDNFRKVTQLRPDLAPAHYRAGLMQQLLRQLDDAIASYQRVLDLEQTYNDRELLARACIQTGYIYGRLLNQRDPATACFLKALTFDPDNVIAQHYLAAAGGATAPARAPDGFVTQLFDEMSERFDHTLVERLGYRTPQLIHEAVCSLLPDNAGELAVLDMGCGTGLCGPLFRDLSGYLAGIDLSPGMIARAREKKVYDELLTGELTATLPTLTRSFDIILSADVFVYIGDLAAIFSSCCKLLTAHGLFAFSVEAADECGGAGYVLLDSGRYAHATSHIDRIRVECGLEQVFATNTVLRRENDQPVNGYIFVLRKPAAPSERC